MQGETVAIREEHAKDAPGVREVNERAFDGPGEARLVAALHAAGRVVVSLVALRGERIVGHILFSTVTIDDQPGASKIVGLAPMAVLPDCQRQGIGIALVRRGLELCDLGGHVEVAVFGLADGRLGCCQVA